MNCIVEPLAAIAIDGHLCSTMDMSSLLLHMMVASYVADILESEDLFTLKKNNRTSTFAVRLKVEEKQCVATHYLQEDAVRNTKLC